MSEPASGVSRFGLRREGAGVMAAAAIHDVREILAALDLGLGRAGAAVDNSAAERRRPGISFVHDGMSPDEAQRALASAYDHSEQSQGKRIPWCQRAAVEMRSH